MPGITALGDSILSSAILKVENRTYYDTILQIFFCGYDPNDKAVYPFGKGPEKYTLMSETLRYTIHFQNTGNDTAFNIAIRDTLSPDIDVHSFHLLASSHNVNTSIKADGSLLFRFDNILLPDSGRSQPLSQGFVTYTVKPKTGLPDYTPVENTAHIFFDLNPAVSTNTTLNTLVYTMPEDIDDLTPQGNGRLIVYPNPSEGQIKIITPQGTVPFTLRIYDTQGRIIYSSCSVAKETIVNLPAPGLYLIRASNETEVICGKVVVN